MIEKYIEKVVEEYFKGARALDVIEKIKGEYEDVKNVTGNSKYISSGCVRNNSN